MRPIATQRNPLLSVVVPCFNEAAVIDVTHRRLVEVLSGLADIDFEIIYVDDGSRDRTLEILNRIHRACGRAKAVSLSRNFGHQMAVTAGIEYASGDAVVLIDADLQDPPEIIPEMVARWRDGADVAYGQRAEREGETRFKLWSARAFYRLIDRLSDVTIPLDTGDFRLMDRRVVDALLRMPERDRFLRGMVAWAGFQQEAVPYKRSPRFAGTTRYPLSKMLAFALNGIVSFSLVPLRLASYVGFALVAASLLVALYALIERLATHDWVPGWALLIVAILFVGGAQLVFLGIMGEYLGRIYGEAKRRPLFVVREQMGFEAPYDVEAASVDYRLRRDRGRTAQAVDAGNLLVAKR